jgi:hypothetical protein
MNLSTGARKRKVKKDTHGQKSQRSKKSKKSKSMSKSKSKSKNKGKFAMPKTAKIFSRKSASKSFATRANSSMSETDLQFLARAKGIPFGGLTKTKLARKINNYY